jgi:hypothetical protein
MVASRMVDRSRWLVDEATGGPLFYESIDKDF